MTTAQEGRQIAVRALTGTALDYNGDWSALFDQAGIAQLGGFNGRLLAWLNGQLGSSYANLNDGMQAYAISQGFANWSSMNTVTSGAPVPPGGRVFIVKNGVYLTRSGAYLVKAG